MPMQVLSTDAAKAINMIKRMAAEPTAEGTPKASKNALIPLDYLRRCKVCAKFYASPELHKIGSGSLSQAQLS